MFFGDSNPIYALLVLVPSWGADHNKLEVIKQMIEDEKPAGTFRDVLDYYDTPTLIKQYTYLGVNSCIYSWNIRKVENFVCWKMFCRLTGIK